MKDRNDLITQAWVAILAIGSLVAMCGASCDGGKDELVREQALRQAAEAAKANADVALNQAEQAMSHWQTLAMVAMLAAIVMLIVGTAWGSRAKRDAQGLKQELNDGHIEQP